MTRAEMAVGGSTPEALRPGAWLSRLGGALGSGLLLLLPLFLIALLSAQMSLGRSRGRLDELRATPEIATLSALEAMPQGSVVMLRGLLAPCGPAEACSEIGLAAADRSAGLLVFQERPAPERSARFRERFPLVFPAVSLDLPEGRVAIQPMPEDEERLIFHEARRVVAGDRHLTGFQAGDPVTIQGLWQPGAQPTLIEASGISGLGKADLVQEAESALERVARWRDISALLCLLGGLLMRRALRGARKPAGSEAF